MPHITTREIYKLAIGMYAAAPGVHYFEELHFSLESGMTLTDVYRTLARNPSFQDQSFWFSDLASNRQFTGAFLDRLVGSEVTAEGRMFAEDQVFGALNAGQSRGDVMQRAIDALDAVAHTDANFGQASARFDNRITVAQFRTEVLSFSSTDLAVLQSFIAGVTHDPNTIGDISIGPNSEIQQEPAAEAADWMVELNGIAPSDPGF
jgi:DNA-binding transcriptional regulator YbjK